MLMSSLIGLSAVKPYRKKKSSDERLEVDFYGKPGE